ncbi:MAG: flagella synthesis protein FlgN [Alteromonadaceae bacterium]|jgi:flagella synthesis protein FlgN
MKITELLDKQEAELNKLHALLNNEFDVLKKRELELLENTAIEKEACLNGINQLDQSIKQLSSFDELTQDENHSEQVARIIMLLGECKELNEVNGQIINNSQIAMNRFKMMLQKSIANNSMTYDEKGRTNVKTTSIGIKA